MKTILGVLGPLKNSTTIDHSAVTPNVVLGALAAFSDYEVLGNKSVAETNAAALNGMTGLLDVMSNENCAALADLSTPEAIGEALVSPVG